MQLADIIRQRIELNGPLSFHDFMEMCLYYPGHGYYTSAGEKIGKQGDFYTSSSIGPLLGAMIGRQLEQMWTITGEKEFTIVEYGAGTGMLCRDILQYLQKNPAFYSKLKYCIIEKSPTMRACEKTHLGEKVSWHNAISELAPLTGCVLSNELVDNFSVHQVVMQDELCEVFVDYSGKTFSEVLRPASEELKHYLARLQVSLPRGFRTEINLEAIKWMEEIATSLTKGYVLTIDYGASSADLYRDRKSNGTLLCYYRHTISDQPYSNIGSQDITSHVNFSALASEGEKQGLIPCGFTSQAAFLLSLGGDDHLKRIFLEQTGNTLDFRKYLLMRYTLFVDMGQKYNVLIQRKGVPATPLTGVQHKNPL